MRHSLRKAPLFLATLLLASTPTLPADCTLTNLGITPLPDLGFGQYRGVTGGLYPNGSNQRPPDHEAAGVRIAIDEILPRDTAGNVETNNGSVVLLSIGMSNTTQEFSTFKQRADADPAKHPRLVIVDGAQGGQASTDWTNVNAEPWTRVAQRLQASGLTTNQVQVIWMKQAQRRPLGFGEFPLHARSLQQDLEHILRVAQQRYPNLRLAFLSSRTRAYTDQPGGLNPEPFAFEEGFSTQWVIEKQLAGNLNHDPLNGPVMVPWLSWGPYLWADGEVGRSDQFVWHCTDTRDDFTHPSDSGRVKVADQLLAFFKTDSATTPWYLRTQVVGQPPVCMPTANVTSGLHPLAVEFQAHASDPDGTVRDTLWTFDDGTFSTNANPLKTFTTPGMYIVHLTVSDNQGNSVKHTVPIQVRTTFDRWREVKFTPAEQSDTAISDPRADPDFDAIANDKEYVLGLEPKQPNGPGTGLPEAGMDAGHFTLSFTRYQAASDLEPVPRLSSDLELWETGSLVMDVLEFHDLGPVERVRVRQLMPMAVAGRGFFDVNVESRQP